jgi:multiple sugar transport system permease protein
MGIPYLTLKVIYNRALIFAGAVILLFWTLAPVYWLFISAISPSYELSAYPTHLFPSAPTFERLSAILSSDVVSSSSMQTMASPANFFKKAIYNSFIVSGTTTIICLLLGSLSGYAFSRLRFPGRKGLMLLPIVLQMLPPMALIIPLYTFVQKLGLIDSLAGLIFVYPSFLLVYVVWVMTGYYQNIPIELEDAARVDGCSRLGVFFRIILPLSTPAIFSTGLLTFLLAWDEFLYALILTSVDAKTLPVAIGEFSTQFGVDYGMMMAGGFLACFLPVLIALLFQPLLIRGLMAGSIKG